MKTHTKLSKLQRWILTQAYSQRPDVISLDGIPVRLAHLYVWEVLVRYYYLPDPGSIEAKGPDGISAYTDHFGQRHKFSMASIGKSRYKAAYAATSRAFARLARRKLVKMHDHGISLTAEGTRACELIMHPKDLEDVATLMLRFCNDEKTVI